MSKKLYAMMLLGGIDGLVHHTPMIKKGSQMVLKPEYIFIQLKLNNGSQINMNKF